MADIHQSDIDNLRQRASRRNYRKYLVEMRLGRVRALRDQRIRFDFPVTALIGTNGGGKSTVLGAAALAYKAIRPGEFFPKSNVGDVSMANWRIDYDLIDRDLSSSSTISRNARFVAAKWRREELVQREVVHFPIKRTVPAGEQPRYKRFIGIYELKKPDIQPLPTAAAKAAGSILGRDLSKYKIARAHKGDTDYILLGEKKNDDISQFHFGAGEASIIEMVTKIEDADDYSLILIEEIENGLHPLATEKMVEYLIDVAKRKKIQVVFTTHSEHALRRLPSDPKWAAIDGELYQGDLNIESLRALTGTVSKEHVIFVEDEFARDWVGDILRQYLPKQMPVIEVHAAGGYPFVTEVTKHHNANPAIKSKAIAIIDGDAAVSGKLPDAVVPLPGASQRL
jgi:ABC-type branched-subunit amino acid transport system ATPase component